MLLAALNWKSSFSDFMFRGSKNNLKKLGKIWFYLSYYITPKQVPCSSGWYSPSEWHICWTLILFEGEDPYKRCDCAKVNLYCVILHQKAANHIERCLGQIHLKLKGAPQFLQSKLFSNFATRNYGSNSHTNVGYYRILTLLNSFQRYKQFYPWVSSGSDQRRSHMGPSWGTSCFRSIVLKLKVWDRVTYYYRRHSDWGRQTWSGRESGWRDSSHRGHRRSCRRWWRTRRGSRRSLCSTSTPASQLELTHISLINALILTKGYLWEGILWKCPIPWCCRTCAGTRRRTHKPGGYDLLLQCSNTRSNSNLCDLTRLVVSSDQGYPVRVTHLKRYQ